MFSVYIYSWIIEFIGHKCYRRNIFPNSVSCIDALNKHNLLAGHAGDRGSSPGCNRHITVSLPYARQAVWMSLLSKVTLKTNIPCHSELARCRTLTAQWSLVPSMVKNLQPFQWQWGHLHMSKKCRVGWKTSDKVLLHLSHYRHRAVAPSPHNHCTILYQRDINFLRYYDKGVVRYRMMRVSVLALSPDH